METNGAKGKRNEEKENVESFKVNVRRRNICIKRVSNVDNSDYYLSITESSNPETMPYSMYSHIMFDTKTNTDF